MKKAILLLCMAAGLMGCAKEILNIEKETPQNEGVPMTFDVSVLETKAAKADWANGDKIYVFFNGLETKYLVLTYTDGTWTNTPGDAELLDTDFDDLGTKKLTAVHFPVAVDVTYADSKFSFTSDGKPVYNYYLYETDKAYTVDGTTVTATLSLGKPEGVAQFHVGCWAESLITFASPQVAPVACVAVGKDGTLNEEMLQAGARMAGFYDGDGRMFAGRLVSAPSTGCTFILAHDKQTFTLYRAGKTLEAGKLYNLTPLTSSAWSVQNASELVVDLGITVDGKKIYWAKYNLGATTETGYGDYFAWGEVTGHNKGKTNFDWSTYYYGNSDDALTKYCNNSSYGKDGFTDELTVLQKEDDAAYAALGGKFRMPTKAEIEALLALSKEWVTDYNSSGINGYKFTGSNGKTLFLPAAGVWNGTEFSNTGYGNYWSSSLGTSSNPYNAWYLGFGSATMDRYQYLRYYGFAVRPVYEE